MFTPWIYPFPGPRMLAGWLVAKWVSLGIRSPTPKTCFKGSWWWRVHSLASWEGGYESKLQLPSRKKRWVDVSPIKKLGDFPASHVSFLGGGYGSNVYTTLYSHNDIHILWECSPTQSGWSSSTKSFYLAGGLLKKKLIWTNPQCFRCFDWPLVSGRVKNVSKHPGGQHFPGIYPKQPFFLMEGNILSSQWSPSISSSFSSKTSIHPIHFKSIQFISNHIESTEFPNKSNPGTSKFQWEDITRQNLDPLLNVKLLGSYMRKNPPNWKGRLRE